MIDLYRINLNLLVALDVLLSEKSVTQAAKKLFLTQAAMSNNLQQLRHIFKDDLLVREKNYMVLTYFASSLQPQLHQLLEETKTLITAGQRFIPSSSQRIFRIGMCDYMSALLLPQLLPTLETQAPGIKITITSIDHINTPQSFENGEQDLMIGKLFNNSQYLNKQLLFKDAPVCVMHPKHPLAQKRTISLKDYVSYQHVTMYADNPDMPRFVEEALASYQVERDIAIGTPYMSTIFQVVQNSQKLLGTTIECIAKLYQQQYRFVIKPVPFKMNPIEFYLIWHPRHQNDLGHRWLREHIHPLTPRSS